MYTLNGKPAVNRHYRDVLNDEQAARIGLIFKREIELSGYSY